MSEEKKVESRPNIFVESEQVRNEALKFRQCRDELDGLVADFDTAQGINRDKARVLGKKLIAIRPHFASAHWVTVRDRGSTTARFEVWFCDRYGRTYQTAQQWMRLAKVYDDAQAKHFDLLGAYDNARKEAEQNHEDMAKWEKEHPAPRKWEHLTVQETLELVRTKQQGKQEEKKDKPKTPKEQVAELEKQLAEKVEELKRARAVRWEESEAKILAVFKIKNSVYEVPAGKVKIGKDTITVDRPILLVPATEMPLASVDATTVPAG
jgi:hypothetical protein